MVPNAPKHYGTHQNKSLGPDGVDRVDLLEKILMQLCGLNFCINYNSLGCFEPSIVKQQNRPKCTQHYETKQNMILGSNAGGPVAFVVKNSDTTLWHEHLH